MVSLPAVLISLAAMSPNVVRIAFTSFGFMPLFSAIVATNAPAVMGFAPAFFGAIARNAKGRGQKQPSGPRFSLYFEQEC